MNFRVVKAFIDRVRVKAVGDDGESGYYKRLPAGRIGTADDISNLVLFLASDESAYCTGTEFVIARAANAVAVIRPVVPQVRLLSESLRVARERSSTAVLDGDFGRDLEHVVNSHGEPLNPPAWD